MIRGLGQRLKLQLQPKLQSLCEDRHLWAVLWLAFTMVCLKKWEPGGNIDTIWYAAVAKNIYLTGDFFHFFISKYYFSQILDHMPLTYWIVGGLFKLLYPSDFIARLYPMVCSFLSYIVVYKIGCTARDKAFGLVSVVTYALVLGASKWNGSLLQDVPLTLYFLCCFYFTLRGSLGWNRGFYLAGVFFAAGILTKGPIIGGFPLALFSWMLVRRDFKILKSPHFYGGLALSAALLAILFLPQLSFNGTNVYWAFIKYKAAYQAQAESFSRYFAYGEVIFKAAFLVLPFFFISLYQLSRRQFSGFATLHATLIFALLQVICIVVPLSFFRVKFPHYMLASYPFLALVAAASIDAFLRRHSIDIAAGVRGLAMTAVCAMVFLPIKTTGGRAKEALNLVNQVKLDADIANKEVYFYGTYDDGMEMFQTFKFYSDIDLHDVDSSQKVSVDLKHAYVVVPKERMPVEVSGRAIKGDGDCYAFNGVYCLVTDSSAVRLQLPNQKFPHEIYSTHE